MAELRQNEALGTHLSYSPEMETQVVQHTAGQAFEQIFNAKYGAVARIHGIHSASTDFVGTPCVAPNIRVLLIVS